MNLHSLGSHLVSINCFFGTIVFEKSIESDTPVAMTAANSSTVTSRAKGDSPTPAPAGEHDDAAQKNNDFFWTYTEEPHRTRRLAIIKAHPEVRHFSIDPTIAQLGC